jgi:hypothetical protein
MNKKQGTSPSVKIDCTNMQSKGDVDVRDSGENLEIVMSDVEVKKIRDQKQQMIQAIGCYNNPGGPTC